MREPPVEPNGRVTFRIVHHADGLLVVEKPAGLVTQPGVGHQHDTLLNGLFARFPAELARLGKRRDWGLIHRLDRETSGLLVVGLEPDAYDGVRELFAARRVRKFYWAACLKAPNSPSGVVRRPIGEQVIRDSKYTSVKTARLGGPDAKPALTAWRVLDRSDLGALIEARPITGRLHQVRVHLASLGAAVLGDSAYGPRRVNNASHRLALHAHRLAFDHPLTGERFDFHSPWPRDLRPLLKRLGLGRPDQPRAARPQADMPCDVNPADEPAGGSGDEPGGQAVDPADLRSETLHP